MITRDVTTSILTYRECVRHMWNVLFANAASWDVRDEFDEICASLSRVLSHHLGVPVEGAAAVLSGVHPFAGTALRVIPVVEAGTPIMINRSSQRSGYWDDSVASVIPAEVELRFVRFFDWNDLGIRDLQYCEVMIEAFAQQPHLVGRSALIEVRHVRIVIS